jgi:hypothetical protein
MDRPWSVLVLRDMGGDRWPAIYLAGPEGSGGVTLPSATGSFTLRGSGADVQLSGGGRQDRRLGGELSRIAVTPGKDGATQASTVYPDLGITITLAEPGKCRGRIVFNGRTLELNGTATIRPCRPTGKGVDVSGRFLTTKGALGLGGTDAKVKEHPVEIEFWTPARP